MCIEVVVAFVFLSAGSFFDIRTKKIPLLFFLLFGAVSMIFLITQWPFSFIEIIKNITIGLLLLLVAVCTREGIGYGDGIMVVILGLLVGWKTCLLVVAYGLFLSAVFSVILLLLKKANVKTRIPYVPFLLVGLGVFIFGAI